MIDTNAFTEILFSVFSFMQELSWDANVFTGLF